MNTIVHPGIISINIVQRSVTRSHKVDNFGIFLQHSLLVASRVTYAVSGRFW